MTLLVALLLLSLVVLVVSTDQFVAGASTVAEDMQASPVLVGAIILGCGTGLPEFALAFYHAHESPFRQLLHLDDSGGANTGLAVALIVMVTIFSLPVLFPDRIKRHSPAIMAATIGFSALLRGSLDRLEAFAMLAGFIIGVGLVIRSERQAAFNPFAPLIRDKYDMYGAYVDTPALSRAQLGFVRVLIGLLGTAVGAQIMASTAGELLALAHATPVMKNMALIGIGSLLPHIVVAFQAVRQHHEGLAIGNLIGSNLFNSLIVGGVMSIIRPYQQVETAFLSMLGVIVATAWLTWMLLRTSEDDMSRRSAVGLILAYATLVLLTVL